MQQRFEEDGITFPDGAKENLQDQWRAQFQEEAPMDYAQEQQYRYDQIIAEMEQANTVMDLARDFYSSLPNEGFQEYKEEPQQVYGPQQPPEALRPRRSRFGSVFTNIGSRIRNFLGI